MIRSTFFPDVSEEEEETFLNMYGDEVDVIGFESWGKHSLDYFDR